MIYQPVKNKISAIFILLITISFFAWQINRISLSSWGIIALAVLLLPQFIKKTLKVSDILIVTMWLTYITGGLLTYILQNNTPLAPSQQFFPTAMSGIVPLAVFLCSNTILNRRDLIEKAISASFLSLIGFFFLVVFGMALGYGKPIPMNIGDQFNVDFKLGQIVFNTTATWIGCLAIMPVPICWLIITTGQFSNAMKRLSFFLLIICTVSFIKSFTRSSIIGLIINFTLLYLFRFFFWGKFAMRHNLVYYTAIIIMIASFIIIDIPSSAIDKLIEFKYIGLDSPNIVFRQFLIENSLNYAWKHFYGIGFGVLWNEMMLDEVNFFAWAVAGTGLLGAIGLVGVALIYTIAFVRGLFKIDPHQKLYSIAGLITLLSTIVSSQGNDKILYFPQSTIPFWVIITCCYIATRLPSDHNPFLPFRQVSKSDSPS